MVAVHPTALQCVSVREGLDSLNNWIGMYVPEHGIE